MNRYKLLFFLLLILSVGVVSAQLPSHIPYRRGKLWGFSDSTKKILIKPRYRNISIIYPNTFIAEKEDTLLVLNCSAKVLFKVKKNGEKEFYSNNIYKDSLLYGIINDTTFGVFNILTSKCILASRKAANYEFREFEQEEGLFIIKWFTRGQRRISGVQESRKSERIIQVHDVVRKKLIIEKIGDGVVITEDFFYRPNKKSVLLWIDSLYCYFDDTLITSTKYSSIKSLGHGLFYVQKYGSQRTSGNRYGGIGQIVTQKDSVLNFDINSILLIAYKGQVNREGNYVILSSDPEWAYDDKVRMKKLSIFRTDSNYSFLNPFLSIKPWSDNPKYNLIKIDKPWGKGWYRAFVDTLAKDTLIIKDVINTKYLIGNFYLVLTISSKENEGQSWGQRKYIDTYHYSMVNTIDRSIKHLFNNEHEIDVATYKDSLGNLYIYDGDRIYGIDSLTGEVTEGKTITEWLGKKEKVIEIIRQPSPPSKYQIVEEFVKNYTDSIKKHHQLSHIVPYYFWDDLHIDPQVFDKEILLEYSFNDSDFFIGYSVNKPLHQFKSKDNYRYCFDYDKISHDGIEYYELVRRDNSEDSVLYLKRGDVDGDSLLVFPPSMRFYWEFPQGILLTTEKGTGIISDTRKVIIKPKYVSIHLEKRYYSISNYEDTLVCTNFLIGEKPTSWGKVRHGTTDVFRKSDCKLLIRNIGIMNRKDRYSLPSLIRVSNKKGKEFYIDIYGTKYRDRGIRAIFSTLSQAILH